MAAAQPGARRSRGWQLIRAVACAALFATVACAGPNDDNADAADTAAMPDNGGGFHFGDTTIDGAGPIDSGGATDAAAADTATPDAPPVEASGGDAYGLAELPSDGGGAEVVALQVEGPSALEIADSAGLVVIAKDSQGQLLNASGSGELAWRVDGAPAVLGFDPAGGASGVKAIALWKDKAGAIRVVGVRPGSAKLSVELGAQTSAALTVTVSDSGSPGIAAAVPDAKGATDAAQVADVPDSVKVAGSTIGGGGLDASLRFPAAAKAGDAFEISANGKVAASAGFADLAGTKYAGAQGYVFIDQTTKGMMRGTAYLRSAALKPVVMRFAVERDGAFGVDALDDGPTTLATSDSLEPTTGLHHSRLHALPGAPGSGRFHLLWRTIENGLKAQISRADVNAVTGAVDASAGPFLSGLNAYEGSPTVPAVAFGRADLAWSGDAGLLLFEGRDGNGAQKPHRLHAMRVDADLKAQAPAAALGADGCAGLCRSRVLPLAGGRFLVVWSAPGGGVRARRVKAQLEAGALTFVEADPLVVSVGGKDSDAAVHGANVLMTWFDPDTGPVWRRYQDQPSGALSAVNPPQAFGVASTQVPAVAVDALTLGVPSPNLLFVAGWIDLLPSKSVRLRRIGLDGTALAATQVEASINWDQLALRSGQPGQVVLFGRTAGGAIVVQKRVHASFADPGATLGGAFGALGSNSDGVVHTSAYLPESATWLLGWGGLQKSKSLAFRRFR